MPEQTFSDVYEQVWQAAEAARLAGDPRARSAEVALEDYVAQSRMGLGPTVQTIEVAANTNAA